MHDTVELRVIRPLPGDRWSLDPGTLGEPGRWLPGAALPHRVAEETVERFLEVVACRLPANRATTAAGGDAP